MSTRPGRDANARVNGGHPAKEWLYSTFAGWGWRAEALAIRAAFAMPASAAAFFESGAEPGCTTPADMIRVAASSVLMSTSTILLLGTWKKKPVVGLGEQGRNTETCS